MKEMSQVLLSLNLCWILIGKYLDRYFLSISSYVKTEKLVNVHKVAKNPEVLCKQYASKEKKNIEFPQNFMAFLRTLLIALTIHVRIMGICCCPVQIFAINPFTPKSDLIDFTLSNARRFYSSKLDPSGVKGLKYYLP